MSSHGGLAGPDFDLSDDVLSVIPTDPYDQLDLARKITSMAITSRVTKLQSEADHLLQKLREKDRTIVELEDKVFQLEAARHEIELRLQITREDNMQLMKEKDSLALAAAKFGRNLAKLQNFKRQLMQSLNDEISMPTETVDIGSYDQFVSTPYPSKDYDSVGYPKDHSFSGSRHSVTLNDNDGQIFSASPSIISRLTPPGIPAAISSNVSSRGYSDAGSPQRTSGSTSPTQYEGWCSVSSQFSSSHQSSGTTSPTLVYPPPARNPRVNVKEFFHQARTRLSLEQFSAFLDNVKELNAQRQSREETLRKAADIFGMDNQDLCVLFQGLLSHRAH